MDEPALRYGIHISLVMPGTDATEHDGALVELRRRIEQAAEELAIGRIARMSWGVEARLDADS